MKIQIEDSFDLQKIIDSGQCFRPFKLNDRTYRFIYQDSILDISPLTDNEYEISCSKDEWENIWSDYFDLDTCYNDILLSVPVNDTYMKRSADTAQGIRILKQDKWEMLISFIISQRKSIPAIRSAVEKICRLYGKCISFRGDNIYTFPTASEMKNATFEELSACGLGYRTGYILSAIEEANSGVLNLDKLSSLNNDDLDEALKSIKGVGNKVSNCVMLFAYHRVDRVPIDTWILKVINNEYNGSNPFPGYGKYAGIMQQYIFYSARFFADSIK